MDPATSELAQVATIATSIVGAVVYLQKAQMAVLTKLSELLKTDGVQELREDVRRLDDKVDGIATDLARMSGRLHSKRPASPTATPPNS